MHRFLSLACALAVAAPAIALAQDHDHDRRGGDDMDMKPIMRRMGEDLQSMPMTGDPDVDFARMMARHHEGGIEIAQEELRHGRNPKIRRMAEKMIRGQTQEMHELRRFSERHGEDHRP